MAFSVTPDQPDLGTLQAGESVDRTFTFAGVPSELSSSVVVPFHLGTESVSVALGVTLDEPDPVVGAVTLPAGLSATVLSIDDVQAVIHFARS